MGMIVPDAAQAFLPCIRLQASNDAASELAGLHQEVEALRAAVRARDDFIAIAAHELRNPRMSACTAFAGNRREVHAPISI
jgi:hypothetical protein